MDQTRPPVPSSIQMDLFCTCGYNLCAQVVHVDDRLQIPVCRCPECGRWHALGTTLKAATSSWMAHAGALGALFYIAMVFWVISMAALGLGFLQFGFLEILHEADRMLGAGYQYFLTDAEAALLRWGGPLLAALCAIGGAIFMAIVTGLFWHWPRHTYWYVLVLAPLAAVAVYMIGIEEHERSVLVPNALERLAMCTIAQLAGMAVGILIGRKIVRGILRMFLAGRFLQGLAFLWLVDAKTPPRPEFLSPPAPERTT